MQSNHLSLKTQFLENKNLHLSITPQDVAECPPLDVVVVVDRSGSMAQECTASDENGQKLENGFSVLDIVKHATKTVINALRPVDRLSVIVYNHETDKLFDLTLMSDDQKKVGVQKIDEVHTGGTTFIYEALAEAIKIVESRDDKSRNPAILLFTDGLPSQSPPEGEVEAIKKLGSTCPIHTFGFGYNLNSDLLYDMAQATGGMNCFIPDATLVGTIFVNAISNSITTAAIDVKVTIETPENREVLGDFLTSYDSGKLTINVGTVRYGQSLDLVIEHGEECQNPQIEYINNNQKVCEGTTGQLEDYDSYYHKLRLRAVQVIKESLVKPQIFGTFIVEIEELKPINDLVDKLVENLKEQVKIAFSDKSFMQKWGFHYLRSLIRSLQLQIKKNFKDPAVADFGGKLFNEFVERADDIFDNMPPPKPSVKKRDGRQFRAVQSMSTYNNSRCVCFAGECTISMADGSLKQIQDLRKGDSVKTPNGEAKIVCILKTTQQSNIAELCKFPNGLVITPWHPIMSEGTWVFPQDIVTPEWSECDAVYSLVIDKDHIVSINGTQAICLGHNYTEGILKHEYFGSQKVIDDLKQMPGFEEGWIDIMSGTMEFSNEGLIAKLIYTPVEQVY